MGHLPDLKNKPLKPKQMNALQMTLDGHSRASVCAHLGITPKTLWNWRQLPAWNEQVSLVIRQDSSDGQSQIKSLLPLATQTLKKLLVNGGDTVKLGAARTILEAHANLIAREEQQQMISQLEEQLVEVTQLVQAQRLPPGLLPKMQPIARTTAHIEEPIDAEFSQTADSEGSDPPLS